MSAQKKTPIRASTQNHLNISDVQDNLIFLKNGSCCLILQTTAINFGLLSEKEQEATIYAYAGLLNSLTFPLQILIHSRQKDVSSYLSLIDQQLKSAKNERIKNQIQDYRQFIENTVQKNKILDKKFYLIISYTPIRKISQEALLEKARVDLYPKRDHLISQFQRLGLKIIQLNNQKIIEILYNIYNPASEGQKFVSPEEYAAPFVQAAIKSQPPTLPRRSPENVGGNRQVPQSSTSTEPTALKPKTHRPRAAVRQSADFGDARPDKAPSPIPTPTPSQAAISTQPVSFEKAQTPHPPSPYDLNPMMPRKKEAEQHLEGQKLQEKINGIVKKVASQAPIQKNKNAVI